MTEKKYKWHKVAESERELSIRDNGIGVVEVNGKRLCVARFQDKWYAFGFTCPHAGGILANGYLDAAGNVVCPVHHYRFNLKNGRNTSGEGFYLKTYPAELRADGMFIAMQDGGFFSWFTATP